MGKFAKITLGMSAAIVGGVWLLVLAGENVESSFAAEDAQSLATATPSATITRPATVAPPAPEMVTAPPAPQPVKMNDLDDAEKAIRLAINLSGNLCAKPIEVREVGANLYGVHCITNRDGTGRSNYLVNSRTNEVDKI